MKVGRSNVKRWGLIFTCLTYRAVHLEILHDMSAEHCIMAIRRFVCRRGPAAHFYSDNGTNFVGASNLLHKDLLEFKEVVGEMTANKLKIHWHFTPAFSPWFGGAWERLIQSIKRCLHFLLHEEHPQEHILSNAFVEAEFWMNSRPLTDVPIDHESAPPLTPNTVLFGTDEEKVRAVGSFDAYGKFSPRATRRTQHLVDKFLHRWVSEYLPTLMRRTKWHKEEKPVVPGDVVVVIEPNEPRNAWRKGIVVDVHPGPDERVRAVDVKLADGSIKKNRSVGRVVVLDVSSPPAEESDGPRDVVQLHETPTILK